MAARKEILSDLSSKIADGNISDAYRTFEQLPVVDQIAVSISPGVGDALAAYEVGEFGRRAKTNVQDKDYLGAAGNRGLQILSGISLIPLFRFLRGARGVTKTATKAVDAPKTLKPPVEEPLPPAPPKEPKAKLPKVDPFEPKGIKEISYKAGDFELGSKARKWVNGIEQPNITTLGKKVQKLPAEQWVQRLQNAGVPKGELRLLNILDESNSIHPKLIMSADAKKSLSRKSLDDYIARSQRDAIQVRSTPKAILESESYRPGTIDPATQGQFNYFVKGSGEYRKFPHHNQSLKYPDGFSGDNAYVFDGTGKGSVGYELERLRNSLSPNDFKTISKGLKELDINPTNQYIPAGKNIFRMQSDFQEEVSKKIRKPQIDQMISAKSNFDSVVKIPRVYQEANKSIKDAISVGPDARIAGTQRTELMNNLKPEFVDALRANDEQAMRKILGDDLYKTFTDTEFGTRVSGKYFAPVDELSSQGPAISFNKFIYDLIRSNPNANLSQIKEFTQTRNKIGGEALKYIKDNFLDADFDGVVKEIFKRTKNLEQIKQKIFKGKPTGFVKPEQQKELIKRLKNYNKEVDAVNDLIASGADVDVDRIIGSLNRDVTDLGIDSLSISPRELERITGKPFTDSLDLSKNDIFNLTDRAGKRVYKDIDFDDSNALYKAYFDDIADQGKTFFNAADGVKVLKKAVGINQSQHGMKIDPYFDHGNSKYFKLPVRANILDSANKGDEYLFIGNQQAVVEGFDTDIVKTYKSAQNEIKKVLKELGVGEEGVVKTIKGTGTAFDGTYLKFTDELKKAIEEQGVNAFKDGGAVGDDDLPDVGSIEPLSLIDTNNNFNIGKMGAGLALSQFLPTSTAFDLANKINLTPAQSAYASSMFAPGSSSLDAAGQFPSFPGRDVPLEQAFAGEPMPSIKENIAAGGIDRYLFAPLQGLGVLGDAAYGIPVAGPLIASGLKTPVVAASILSGIAKAGKSKKSLPKSKRVAPGLYEYRGFAIEDVGTNYGLPRREWSFGKLEEGMSAKDASFETGFYQDSTNSLKEAKEFIDRVYFGEKKSLATGGPVDIDKMLAEL